MAKLSLLKINQKNRLSKEAESEILGGSCTNYSCQCGGSWEGATYNGHSGSEIVSVTLNNRSSAGTI